MYPTYSCSDLSYPVLSCSNSFSSYPTLPWFILSCPTNPILVYPILSWLILSCPILPYSFLLWLILSYPILSCSNSFSSYPTLPRFILSCPTISPCPILVYPYLDLTYPIPVAVLGYPILTYPYLFWLKLSNAMQRKLYYFLYSNLWVWIFASWLTRNCDQNHLAPNMSFPPASDSHSNSQWIQLHLCVIVLSIILKYFHPSVCYVCMWYLWGAYVICVCVRWRGHPHLSSTRLLARTLWCAFRMAIQLSALPLAWQLFISFETALVDIRLSEMARLWRGRLTTQPTPPPQEQDPGQWVAENFEG